MKKLTILLFSFIIITACNNNLSNSNYITNKISIDDFQKIEIKGEIMELDTIWDPLTIYVKDSILYLINRSGDYLVQTFNLNDNSFLSYNVGSGLGPNEYIACNQLIFNDECIMIPNFNAKTINKYKYQDFISTPGCLPFQTIDLLDNPHYIVEKKEGNFIVGYYPNNDSLICEYDVIKKININFAKYPDVLNSEFPTDRNFKNYYHGVTCYNKVKDKIVVPYMSIDMIDIYNSDFTLYKRIIGPKDLPCSISDPIRDTYPYCDLTSNYIFVLYSGKQVIDEEEFSNQIFVFDYEGNPIKILNLDIPIYNFCIDENNNCIYALTMFPEFSVVKFKYE